MRVAAVVDSGHQRSQEYRMITPQELLKEARNWEGAPFRHQGRSMTGGTDCIGFPVCILQARCELPTDFVDNIAYGPAPNSSAFIDTVKKFCTPLTKIEDGCMIAIKWPFSKWPSHAAIIDGPYMIHAYQRKGKVIRHSYGEPWLRMTHSIWRLPGVSI